MGEWKRNKRRTNGFPRGLEGRIVEARHRDGEVFTGVVGEHDYLREESFNTADGFGGDVMAYRIIEDDPELKQESHAHTFGIDGDTTTPPDGWPEDRIDVIGQNGNTGEHYNEVKMMNGKVELIPTPERIAFLKENAASAEGAFDRGKPNKYQRTIKGVTVDVYDVLVAFGVTCPAMAHAIKKMLMPGQRGSKDAEQDKREAIQAIERSIDLHK